MMVSNVVMAIIWMIVVVVLGLIEIATLGLTTIWFAGGALVAAVAALCHAPLWLQLLLFLVVSILLLFSTRPIAMRYFNGNRARTNVEGLVGQKGIVTAEIDDLKGTGQVTLNGLEWTARAKAADGRIEDGAVVVVCGVEGVKLIVEKV